MATHNWGQLPAEIIIKIFECFNKYDDNYTAYQLVNKHWFFASMCVVYKNIVISDSLTSDFKNWEKLNGLYSLLTNSNYDVSQYVKQISFYSTKNLHFLGLLMKSCPNVEQLSIEYSIDVCDYIISAQKQSEDDIIRKKLKIVYFLTEFSTEKCGRSFYRCLYGFRNNLTYLDLPSIPAMPVKDASEDDSEDDNTQSSLGDLCAYIKEFKNLEELVIRPKIFDSVFDCEHLQDCSPIECYIRIFK